MTCFREDTGESWKWGRQADSYLSNYIPMANTSELLSGSSASAYLWCIFLILCFSITTSSGLFSLSWMGRNVLLHDLLWSVDRSAFSLILTPGTSCRWIEAWSSLADYGKWRMWSRTWEAETFPWYSLGFCTTAPGVSVHFFPLGVSVYPWIQWMDGFLKCPLLFYFLIRETKLKRKVH